MLSSANKWYSKSFWALIFIACSAACVYNLYLIFINYYSYPTATNIYLGYEPLSFPTVTICNLNAIRKSQAVKASKLHSYLGSIQKPPDRLRNPPSGQGDSGGSRGRGRRKVSVTGTPVS